MRIVVPHIPTKRESKQADLHVWESAQEPQATQWRDREWRRCNVARPFNS